MRLLPAYLTSILAFLVTRPRMTLGLITVQDDPNQAYVYAVRLSTVRKLLISDLLQALPHAALLQAVHYSHYSSCCFSTGSECGGKSSCCQKYVLLHPNPKLFLGRIMRCCVIFKSDFLWSIYGALHINVLGLSYIAEDFLHQKILSALHAHCATIRKGSLRTTQWLQNFLAHFQTYSHPHINSHLLRSKVSQQLNDLHICCTNCWHQFILPLADNYRINSHQEFRAMGLANLIGSIFSCTTTSGNFSRTAVRTPLSQFETRFSLYEERVSFHVLITFFLHPRMFVPRQSRSSPIAWACVCSYAKTCIFANASCRPNAQLKLGSSKGQSPKVYPFKKHEGSPFLLYSSLSGNIMQCLELPNAGLDTNWWQNTACRLYYGLDCSLVPWCCNSSVQIHSKQYSGCNYK